jgi:hypothetical protein
MQKEAGLGKGAERGCNGGIAWGRLNPEVHLFSGGASCWLRPRWTKVRA